MPEHKWWMQDDSIHINMITQIFRSKFDARYNKKWKKCDMEKTSRLYFSFFTFDYLGQLDSKGIYEKQASGRSDAKDGTRN